MTYTFILKNDVQQLSNMEIFHLPTKHIDDTYLGIDADHKHAFPSFPARLEKIKRENDLSVSLTRSLHFSDAPLARSTKNVPLIRPLSANNKLPRNESLVKIRRTLRESSSSEQLDYIEPISNSFSTFHTTSAATQSDGSVPILKKRFNDLKETRNWTTEEVDPFLKNLRAAIITNKPEDIQEYCALYCVHLFHKKPPPQTIERFIIEDSHFAKIRKGKKNARNTLIQIMEKERKHGNEMTENENNDDYEFANEINNATDLLNDQIIEGDDEDDNTTLSLSQFIVEKKSESGKDLKYLKRASVTSSSHQS